MRTLVEHGANVGQADVPGITPLMAAAYGGYVEIVGLLLAHGADPAAIDRVGKTAMEYAAGQGNTAVVQLLLDGGVDVNRVYKNKPDRADVRPPATTVRTRSGSCSLAAPIRRCAITAL